MVHQPAAIIGERAQIRPLAILAECDGRPLSPLHDSAGRPAGNIDHHLNEPRIVTGSKQIPQDGVPLALHSRQPITLSPKRN